MLDFVQQLVSGIALGCVYGLIALGFVLIYKATEVVNFAQGDLMMLGGFFGFTFIGMLGFNYWLGFAGAVIAMALFGMLAERVVVRPILGYPQFSIIMVTIGLGYFLRSMAGIIWGTDDLKIDTPFSQGVLRIGSLVLAYDKLSVIAATVILCTLLYLFFNRTTLGTAMRATSENMLAAYYMGIPVKMVVALTWAISAAVAACAGVLLAPITFIHSNVGASYGFLEKIFVVPRFHHWHHGIEKEAIDVNFAIHFPWIDKIFGTYYYPEGKWPDTYGLANEKIPGTFWGQTFYPFIRKTAA